MKDISYIRPPRMSMNFSESKSGMKKRFSNILDSSAKKKGIGALVIILIIVVCISVFIAISFNKKTEDVVVAKKYELGKEVMVDLDGDGVDERIYYGLDDFIINDVSYMEDIRYSVYENNPVRDTFIITDIDTKDSQKEIVLLVEGPSNDPEGFFFTYKNGSLINLGSVPSYLDVSNFDGNGNINGNLRLSILQTWWAPAVWEFNEEGKISLRESDIYYPIQPQNEWEIVLNEDLPVYERATDSKQMVIITPQRVKITATDNRHECFIEAEDGKSGWFMIDDFYNIVNLDGKPATDVFSNLCMAD